LKYADTATLDGEVASPSSRRAWIEIISPNWYFRLNPVALLAEGVD